MNRAERDGRSRYLTDGLVAGAEGIFRWEANMANDRAATGTPDDTGLGFVPPGFSVDVR